MSETTESEPASSSCSGSVRTTPTVSTISPNLKWVNESETFFPAKKRKKSKAQPVGEVELIRSRLKKRQVRPREQEDVVESDTKRGRNTLAARRYRERQRKDVEVLDARIRQIEEELNKARLEAMWWKAESSRWKEEALRHQQ